jgi:putative ABC transport system permease protein
LETLIRDVRYALRVLAKSPGFTAVAALTLALGLGANTAIFSVVEALLVRPLPFPEPTELVAVYETQPGERTRPVAPANFFDWRAASRSFTGLAAWQEVYRNLVGTGQGVRLDATIVSQNFFDVLGVKAARGRTFTAQGGGPRQAVLSHALWRDRFGADPAIVGQPLRLDDEPFEIVGVLPPGPVFPEESELWLLARDEVPELGALAPIDVKALRDSRYFAVLGRLAPGVDRAAAQNEMDVIARRLVAAYPIDNADAGINVVSLQDQLVGPTRPSLLLLMGAVGFVLLLGCANVANLLLARAVRREKEIAIRSALGAGRSAIARQLLTESGVLAALGAGLGLLLAAWAGQAVLAWLPAETPRLADVRLSWPVLAFTLALTVLVTALFGLVPALGTARTDLRPLRDTGRTSRSDPARERTRAALVVAELAVALVLVTAAGLLAKSLWRLQTTPSGLEPERVLSARVSLPGADRRPASEARGFYTRVVERLAALPGVEAAGAVQALPFKGPSWQAGLKIDGRAVERNREPDVCWRVVTPEYFPTLGVPLVGGRFFTDSDTSEAPAVALVNRTLARRLFAGEDPIGHRIVTGLDGNKDSFWVTIVGVVGDTPQESVAAPILPEVYRPLAQDTRYSGESIRVVVRAAGDPLNAAAGLRAAVADLDPEVPVSDVATLAELGRGSIARQRVTGQMLGVFAVVALLLAALGLYGVLSALVGERRHEIGVRTALGARPADVIAMVMARSGRLALAGIVLGTAGALATTRLLASFLYEVTATDPTTFALVIGVLAATAAIASYLPARRATRVDPLVALRSE